MSSEAKARPLAVFDLDGTLVRKDTYLSFLLYAFRRSPRRWWRAPVLAWGVILHKSGQRTNSWLKSLFLRHVLGHLTSARRRDMVERFLDHFLSANLRSGGTAECRDRRERGEEILLLSASPDFLVKPIARRLGIENQVSTVTGTDGLGRLTGELVGGNCHGEAKVSRLAAYRAEHGPFGEVTVFTDHHSDGPLLQQADHPVAVHPTAKLRALLEDLPKARVVDWDKD